MNTGLIGLGAMGEGMARNLAKAGYLTCVYNRSAEKANNLATELNLSWFQTISELAASVEVLLTCVSEDSDVLEVINAAAPYLKAGSVLVDCSTVSADTATEAAHLLARHNVHFLDAPVSGGVEGARKGTLAMMVGGDAKVLERVTPVLSAIATRISHMGDTGAGQATKAVNQIMAAGINQAVTEALSFARALDLPMDKVIDVVSGGAAGNWFLEHRGPSMSQGRFAPGFKLKLHAKDLRICQAMADSKSIALPLTLQTLNDYQRLIEQGFGDEDISALFRLKTAGS